MGRLKQWKALAIPKKAEIGNKVCSLFYSSILQQSAPFSSPLTQNDTKTMSSRIKTGTIMSFSPQISSLLYSLDISAHEGL